MPSIDVPLLRSERTAFRSKRLWRWGLGGVLGLSGALGLALLFPYRAAPSEQRAGTTPPVDPSTDVAELTATPHDPSFEGESGAFDSPTEGELSDNAGAPVAPAEGAPGTGSPARSERAASTPLLDRTSHTFGNALSFRDALEHAGLTRDESTELIAGLSGVIDFRRSHPEDTFSLARSESGALARFEYRASLTQRYEATRDANGKWKARQLDVPVRMSRVAKSGVVVGSLGDTLEALKLGRALAGVFSEVFEGQVSFSTDTRAGDEFRIIFDEEYVDGSFLRHGAIHAVEYKGEKAGKLRAFWYEPSSPAGADGDFYDEHGRALHGGWLRTPLRYDHVSSGFGMRFHPVLKRKQLHNGIDYAASSGTPVRAAAAGTVTFAGPKGANGNLVVIAHAQGFESFYAHLSRFATGLKAGAKVKQRQIVAYVGTTGRSTGPHLHFSLKKAGKFLDPASQLNGPGLPMPAAMLPEYKRRVRELSAALEKLTPEQPTNVAPAPATVSNPSDLGEEEL
jgi:murein DD-endopeptidase MepM/ murein hydrolase activator NlpD